MEGRAEHFSRNTIQDQSTLQKWFGKKCSQINQVSLFLPEPFPKDVHVLMPGIYDDVMFLGRGDIKGQDGIRIANQVTLRWGGYIWIIQVALV